MTLFGENTESQKLANDIWDTIKQHYKSADYFYDLRHLNAYQVLAALAMNAEYVATHWEADELVPNDDPPRLPPMSE